MRSPDMVIIIYLLYGPYGRIITEDLSLCIPNVRLETKQKLMMGVIWMKFYWWKFFIEKISIWGCSKDSAWKIPSRPVFELKANDEYSTSSEHNFSFVSLKCSAPSWPSRFLIVRLPSTVRALSRISNGSAFFVFFTIYNDPWTMFMLSSQYEIPSSFWLLLVGLQQNSDFLVSQKMYSTWVLLVKSAYKVEISTSFYMTKCNFFRFLNPKPTFALLCGSTLCGYANY